MASEFHHMGVVCQDMAATERFYDVFRVPSRPGHPARRRRRDHLPEVGVGLSGAVQGEGDRSGPGSDGERPEYPGWRHLAFKVDDVDATLAAMGADARITAGPMGFDAFIAGWKSAWVADPDGNIVEISQGYVDEEDPPTA